jgi:hypothetical protein
MITVTRGGGMAPLLNQLHWQNQHDANFAVQNVRRNNRPSIQEQRKQQRNPKL